MLKYFQTVPLLFAFNLAMMCFGYRSIRVLYCLFKSATGGMLGVGVVESLLYGCAVALVVAGFKVFFDRKLHLLGTSLAYAGTFICCWLSRFGVPFMGRFPRRFCIESDYSMLLITSVVLLALHFAISYLRKRYGAKNS